MVKIEGGTVERCCCNVAEGAEDPFRACGKVAKTWNVSWDVTGHLTLVASVCKQHTGADVTPREVRLWGTHRVERGVARALQRRADR